MKRRRFELIRSLSAVERLLLPQLVLASLAIHVALLLVPLERVAAVLDRLAAGERPRRFPLFHRSLDSERLATLADVATRITSGKHRCLPRSLLLLWLMRARHEPVALLVGATKTRGGELEGHAWIEVEGRLVLDSPSLTARFSPFLRL